MSDVSLVRVARRPLAAVRTRMTLAEIPARFDALLGLVYESAKVNGLKLDGQNVFVYYEQPDGTFDIDFGVGVSGRFESIGAVRYTETPAGVAATATHWGEYRELGVTHEAVSAFLKASGRGHAGPVWEVYGHWEEDPAKRRTDVYHLVERDGSGVPTP